MPVYADTPFADPDRWKITLSDQFVAPRARNLEFSGHLWDCRPMVLFCDLHEVLLGSAFVLHSPFYRCLRPTTRRVEIRERKALKIQK